MYGSKLCEEFDHNEADSTYHIMPLEMIYTWLIHFAYLFQTFALCRFVIKAD